MGRSIWLLLPLVSVALIPLRSPQEARRPTAIALGSFDGLHQGHRRVIASVTDQPAAVSTSVPSPVPTVVSFWPHPREVLHGEARLPLDLPAEKLHLLEPLGIQQLVLVPFTHALAALSPEAFVQQVLIDQLAAQRIAVGDNFRFGAGRCGDTHSLVAIGQRHGIDVQVLPMLWDGEERVSSSRVRRALAAGDVAEAHRLLERPYRFSGRVVRGRGLGKELGWPTANLQVDGRKFLPLEGVYAAAVSVAGGALLPGVMNLGPQPTVDPMAPSAVEVHLLDRRLELVGLELQVQPLLLLRRQQTFASFDDLSAQIAADANQARALWAGVGVGQTPTDEGCNPAEQQNP